jgi:hypothetical protein
MDYLPEMPAYLAFNAEQARTTPGGQQLIEKARSLQPDVAELLQSRLKRIYVGIEPSARTQNGCGVAIGDAGFGDFYMTKFRQNGAREQKLSGRTVLTSGSLSVCSVGDNGLLLFARPEDLDKMVRTSQKKNPAARQSGTFKTAETLAASHSFTMATDFTQVLGMIGDQLQRFATMSPKGVEALKQVRTATLTFDWTEQPVGEGMLHLPGNEGREDLAGFINMALGFARTMAPKMDAQAKALIGSMKAEPVENGVSLKITIPKDLADKALQAKH